MNSDVNSKNTNLSLTEQGDNPSTIRIPTRNAISTVKRSRHFKNFAKLNLKPVRLINLTQEILEAANEPLKNVANDGGTSDSDNEIDNLKSEAPTKLCDFNMSCLDTSHKKQPIHDSGICLETPKAKKDLFAAPLPPSTSKTPLFSKLSSASKRAVHCSVDVKDVLRNRSLFPEEDKENSKCSNKISVSGNKDHDVNKVSILAPIVELDERFKEIRVKDTRYFILNELGTGGSSVVYHCYDIQTKSERAIKRVDISNSMSSLLYINEVKVLEKLQSCDRIIKMYDYEIIESEKVLLVVLERGGSDLSKILKKISISNKHLPSHMLIFYWMEMLNAVKQIHQNGIVHNDLKPANFLRAEGGLKLIDFGIASKIQGDMTSAVKNVQIGSFNYISPEALINEPSKNTDSPTVGQPKYKVSYKSDVWSLGCILYQLVYHKTPFQHIGHMWAKLNVIMDPNHQIDYPEVDWAPKKFVKTIKSCLQFNVKARPSVDDLIKDYEDIF